MSGWWSKKSGDSKSGEGSNKPKCICSPTNHPGSFKCHIHRATATSGGAHGGGDHRKSSSQSSGSRSGGGSSFQQITNSNNQVQHWLSRVGKSASASASSQSETDIELTAVGQSIDVYDRSQVSNGEK